MRRRRFARRLSAVIIRTTLNRSKERIDLRWERRQEVQMTYHFSTIVEKSFDDAVAATKEALKRHNFNVLSEINMKDNLKKGLNVEFRPYLILGACNPELTYKALEAEDKLGVLLPCNVIVQRQENGNVEVSAVDPVLSMGGIDHVVVAQVAHDIGSHLQQVINEVRQTHEIS